MQTFEILKLISLTALMQYLNAKPLNQTILFHDFGYSKASTLIDLYSQSIDMIANDTFQGLTNLEFLYLHDNKIQKIDSSLFKGLINIREIWLESNTIISIDKSAFVDLNNLELICLGDNPITFMFPTL